MKKYNFVFVILHYIEINETINFINSIKNLYTDKNINLGIVIVDNNSPNNTGAILKKKYSSTKNIHVILNDKNLGFAKGQNIGFKFAKDNLNPDFIALCNNDILMIQKDFFEIIISEYEKEHYSLIGPKILNNDSIQAYSPILKDERVLKKELLKYRILYCMYFLRIDFIRKIYLKIKFLIFKNRNDIRNKYDFDKKKKNVCLQGSFMIFSKLYIDRFDGINDKTFFYKEEQFIARRLFKNNMISIYEPKLYVRHNNGISTASLNKNERKKNIFIYKNQIYSIKQLLKSIRSNDF